MTDIFKSCPVIQDERYTLRLIQPGDCQDLLQVYSDVAAVPFFNGDGCDGDDFHYQTPERMQEAIAFWVFSYEHGYFVRFTILDRQTGRAIGTIEMCKRTEKDSYPLSGILRLDLLSDYETAQEIQRLLALILAPAFSLFDCPRIMTKAIEDARERRRALRALGFTQCREKLTDRAGNEYGDYFEIPR